MPQWLLDRFESSSKEPGLWKVEQVVDYQMRRGDEPRPLGGYTGDVKALQYGLTALTGWNFGIIAQIPGQCPRTEMPSFGRVYGRGVSY